MSALQDPFNAFVDTSEAPGIAGKDGPLSGLTLAVKDVFDVAGIRSGWGQAEILAAATSAASTAPAVQALFDAGAIYAGKTQTDELAFSLMGQNVHFPHPINPAAPDRVTGGSSSGSAAAIAGGLADIALGSDTGGSIRGPASFCGLVGLRTTHGRISLAGTMPLAPSLDVFGWFAKDLDTYEKVGEILLGQDGHDLAQVRPMHMDALDGLVLGEREAAEYARMSTLIARKLGKPETVAAPSLPLDDLYWAFRRIQAYEAWSIHGEFVARATTMDRGVRERFEFGSTLGCGVAVAETTKRNALRDEIDTLLGSDGVLLLPTMPGAAPLKDSGFDALQDYRERALRLLCLSGLTGLPQITLPLGTVDGAPFGISLLGPRNSDMALIRLARRIMQEA